MDKQTACGGGERRDGKRDERVARDGVRGACAICSRGAARRTSQVPSAAERPEKSLVAKGGHSRRSGAICDDPPRGRGQAQQPSQFGRTGRERDAPVAVEKAPSAPDVAVENAPAAPLVAVLKAPAPALVAVLKAPATLLVTVVSAPSAALVT